MTAATARKIERSAEGMPCQVQLPGVCNGNPATTVWAHSNLLLHGKGVGGKSLTIFGAYACSACHDIVDGRVPRPRRWTKADIDSYFAIANARSLRMLHKNNVIDLGE